MKLAKKTLSVALAAVMAASSFAGTISAFAAVDYLPASDPAFKAVSVGTTKVTPDVKIETKYATADAKDLYKQIDATTLSNYYSFTPAKTGAYTMTVDSTPLFHGVDKRAYDKIKDNKNLTAQDKIDEATVYSNSFEGLYTDATFATALTATDAIDTVTVANVADKDAFVTSTTVASKNAKAPKEYVLSYKFDKAKNEVVEDKKVKAAAEKNDVTLTEDYLVAGKTYYFQVTVSDQATLVTTKNVMKDGKVDKVEAVKSNVPASASITIAMESDELVQTDYTKTEKQEVVVDYNTEKAEYKNGKYIVTKEVTVPENTVTYSGLATSYTVKDEIAGVKVVKFVNGAAALSSLTLGKNVTSVENCATKNLKKVTITNPEFVCDKGLFNAEATIYAPANSIAEYTAKKNGYTVATVCTHKWTTVKAATIFAAGQRKCSECDKVEAIAKKAFAPTAKASKKKIVVKGNAGKVAKLAVWVYDSKGKLVKKQVKKNVTKNTVKVAKAGKYTVKVKAYGTNGAKTASVKKTVKVK